MSIPTVNSAIHSAQNMLEAVQSEAPIAQLIREGDSRIRTVDEFDKQNIVRTQLVVSSWRKIGRQVLAMHPEVVEEVRVSSSDKVPVEILRVLPYINPMVVYSDPPLFKVWTKNAQETVRLLGFFTCGIGEHVHHDDRGNPLGVEQRIYSTTDTEAERFCMMPVFDVLDQHGHKRAFEINTMTLGFHFNGTLADIVDDIMGRFHFAEIEKYGSQSARRRWMREVLGVMIGSLFYLCSTTLEAEEVPKQTVAKKMSKRIVRAPISLYKVGWTTGSALTRYRQARTGSTSEQADISHQQDPQHRRSHFKMQPYGPNKALRKLIFVSAYWTHVERLGMEGVNTTRRVPRVNGKGTARESVDGVLGMAALPVEVS